MFEQLFSLVRVPVLNLVNRLSLKQLMALLSEADLFIGNEAGPMHLATALDRPAVAIIGPTRPELTGPFGNKGPDRPESGFLQSLPGTQLPGFNLHEGHRGRGCSGSGPIRLRVSLSPGGNQRILMIKLTSLGDVIHALPVASRLKKTFPRIKLFWVVEDRCAPVLEAHPLLEEVVVYPRGKIQALLARRAWGAGPGRDRATAPGTGGNCGWTCPSICRDWPNRA